MPFHYGSSKLSAAEALALVSEVRLITDISAAKGALAKLLVTLPGFKPPPGPPQAPNFMMGMMAGASSGQQPGAGWRLQTESLLGLMLAPTCIDTALYKEHSARQVHFSRGLAGRSKSSIESIQRLLRDSVLEVLRQVSAVVAPLLRTDEASRRHVLSWYAALVTGSQAKAKSANLMDQGHGPQGFLSMLEGSPMPFEMQMQMQVMKAQSLGYATSGTCLNAFWSLLELVKPIKLSQVPTLEAFYLLREGELDKEVIGGFLEEARFGDSEEVEAAKGFVSSKGFLKDAAKFPTQIFWLTLRAFHVLLVPVMKENLCMLCAASFFHGKNMATMEAAMGEHFVYDALLGSSGFLGDLGVFLNLVMAFCLSAAFPDKAADFAGGTAKGSILTDEVTPQWAVLPSCIFEDIIEILEIVIQSNPQQKPSSELFLHLDPTLLLYLVTFILGNGQHVKNPNLRGKAATILKGLIGNPSYCHLVENSPVLISGIIPGCIRVFTAVEKTKQSYYDIRMQLKYQLRIPIMELFERTLPLEAHKKALKSFATEFPDEFLKFLNNLGGESSEVIGSNIRETPACLKKHLSRAQMPSAAGPGERKPGAVALWQCCACGREWRAESFAGDDTECCPFAPKVLAFGARSAWAPPAAAEAPLSDDEEDDIVEPDQLEKVSDAASKLSTTPGSRSSIDELHSRSPGADDLCRGADLESFASAFAAVHGLTDVKDGFDFRKDSWSLRSSREVCAVTHSATSRFMVLGVI
eukprot:s904_g4.t1